MAGNDRPDDYSNWPVYDPKTGKQLPKGEQATPAPAPAAPAQRDYSGYAQASGGVEDTLHPIAFLKNLGSGILRGIPGMAGVPGDLQEGASAAAAYMPNVGMAESTFGPDLGGPAKNEAEYTRRKAEIDKAVARPLPTTQEAMDWARRHVPGANAQPTGEGGELAAGQLGAGMGELIPGAVIPGQLGIRGAQLGARAATAGLDLATQAALPTAAAHVATDLAQGTRFEKIAGPAAAIVTSLAGGAATPPRGRIASPVAGEPGYHEGAVANINRAIRDDTSPALAAIPPGERTPDQRFGQVRHELEQVGDQGRIMDVGPNLGGQAQVLAAGPGEARSQVLRTVRERSQERGNRVGAALDDAFGQAEDFDLRNNQLLRDRRENADRLYGEARNAPGSQNVDTAPVVGEINRHVTDTVLTDQTRANPTERQLLDLSHQLANRRDVASLHNIKTNLDDRITEALANPGQGDLARKLIDVRDSLVTQLERATTDAQGNSAYRAAREAYAGDLAVLNARQAGAAVLDRDVRPAQLAREVAALTTEERHGYLSAVREKFATMMDNSTTNAAETLRELEKPGVQQKLQTLIGNDQTNQLLTFARGEQRKQATNQSITGQSATYGRTEAGKEFPSEVDTGRPPPLMYQQIPHAAARWVTDRARQLIQAGQSNAIRTDASRILTAPPQQQAALLQMLQENYGAGGIGPRLARTVPQAAYQGNVRNISEQEPGGQRY